MSVRGKVLQWGRSISGGAFWKERPGLARAAGLVLHFALGALTGYARIFGSCGPFGIAMVARAGPGLGGVFCLLGSACGYLLAVDISRSIRYVAACVLVYTASFSFQELKVYRKVWFMPSVTAAVTLVTGFLAAFETIGTFNAIMALVTEVTRAGGCSYFFILALSGEKRESEADELRYSVGLVILLACLLMSLSGVELLRVVSLGRLLAVLFVMMGAYSAGSLAGSASGAALGLAMDIAGGVPFYTMTYAFSGLFSGIFSRRGRFLFAVSYILSNAVSVFWTWSQVKHISALYEVFMASVIFLLLPSRLLSYAGSLLRPPALGSGESGLRRYTARRASDLADAFRDLYETVRGSVESASNDSDIATVFDRAADAVCVNCKNKPDCWQRNYLDTLSVMNDATRAMLARSRLERGDLPQRFLEKCQSPGAFIDAVNAELRSMLYRRQLRARLLENRSAAYGQYRCLADVMDTVSEELLSAAGPDPLAERRLLRYLNGLDIDADTAVFRDRSGRLRCIIESGRLSPLLRDPDYMDKLSGIMGVRLCRPAAANRGEGKMLLMEAEPLSVSVGIAAVKKEGEPVSGDRGTYFKTDQGVLCVLLSDGMGSGEDAARESISAVRILERFLRAGVEPGTAMRILNSVLLLKNGENWGYATVDLMCIDLFSGETCFYKYGAAPSFVKNGKLIRRVRGMSMAAGVLAGEGESPDVIRMRLKPGSVALVASDGVIAEDKDTWIRALLSSFDGGDTRELARKALQEAAKQYGHADDMTVLAVRVDARR
jgi:stage II sporulation protein E